MSQHVISIDLDTELSTARTLLLKHNIRTLPVKDHSGKLVGTVGLREVLNDGCAITTLREAVTARESDPLLSTLATLTDGNTHAVIVIDDENNVIGLISQTDLLSVIARLLPDEKSDSSGK